MKQVYYNETCQKDIALALSEINAPSIGFTRSLCACTSVTLY